MKALILFALLAVSSPIQLKGIKRVYNTRESIVCSIANSNKADMFVNIAFEAVVNNKWQEVMVDATRRSAKSAIAYQIKQRSSKGFTINLSRLDGALFKNKKATIRLKLYYGNTADQLKGILYSDSVLLMSN